jgi:murein DD-endopeptidase MepM/ murein hydrolase activator NlpD
VIAAGPARDARAGNIVAVQHGNTVTTYAHLHSVSVHVGDPVTEGEQVGILGDTGNAGNTPPHVHFRVVVNGAEVDPETYLNNPCP